MIGGHPALNVRVRRRGGVGTRRRTPGRGEQYVALGARNNGSGAFKWSARVAGKLPRVVGAQAALCRSLSERSRERGRAVARRRSATRSSHLRGLRFSHFAREAGKLPAHLLERLARFALSAEVRDGGRVSH